MENFKIIVLPKSFEEVQKVPLNKPYNFLTSLDKNSIDKEISILGIEAEMVFNEANTKKPSNEANTKWF